ncbi:AAA family ATPase [Sandaracinus amylolyticus]|uniref:ATPase AAA-type core domain-containing protein n=1 Tax=Sandaracinus amylolyticus TaxID=927083 RepID=A0A0F6YH60_9BACT|nr:ATP-binding protein [Sandaracinus amylolyticus]AKF04653.1 hypothetical protein DB32_001802 [Sandaracinus amylolyticus]
MLTTLALEGWKSFGALVELPLARTTLLVGPNASGKSNVLDAIRFLQGIALDLPLTDVLRGSWDGGRQVWPGIRGAEVEAAHVGAGRFTLGTAWSDASSKIEHGVCVQTRPEVALAEEALFDGDGRVRYWFDTHAKTLGERKGLQAGGAIAVAIRATGAGGRNVSATYSASRSLLGQIEITERVDPRVVENARAVRARLRGITHVEIHPQLMRDPAPLHWKQMGASGEHVAAVLHSMSDAQRADLVDWISELCAPRVGAIDFDVVESVREVYFFLREQSGARISARSLSDGTLRFLGILVALLTAPEGSLIVLEEPDVGLHPARVHLLAEILESVPRERNIQVLATTHSPILLAHLSDEVLANVIAFDRDPSTGWSIAKRVGTLPHYPLLRDSEQRDHLIATGWLERAL